MNRTWAGVHYATMVARDDQEGWVAVELTRGFGATAERIARVVFWDAQGQFFIETSANEIPLILVEEMIAEAKQLVAGRL